MCTASTAILMRWQIFRKLVPEDVHRKGDLANCTNNEESALFIKLDR